MKSEEKVEEGLGQQISLALIVGLMAIPDLLAKEDILPKMKQVPKHELRMDSKSVQDIVKNSSQTNKSYGGYSLTNCINMAARTIYREGREETHEDRLAIASILFVRADKNLDNIPSVIAYPSAFSCWNKMTSSDWKNFIYRIPEDSTKNKIEKEAWEDSVRIAKELFSGNFKSTIGDRNSYYNQDKVTPDWAKDLTQVKKIGHHKFGYLTSEDPKYKGKTIAKTNTKRATLTYVVKSGDNLSKIAKQHKTTVADIKKNNNLKNDMIKPGQKLKV